MTMRRINRHIASIQKERAERFARVLKAIEKDKRALNGQCTQGHLLTPDNLTAYGRCRKCHNDTTKRWQTRRPKVSQKIPAEPLAGLIYRQLKLFDDGLRGVAIHLANNLGTEDWETVESELSRIYRHPEGLVLRKTADRIIIGLNSHPSIIYDPKVWEALPA
jgi:cytochrome c553